MAFEGGSFIKTIIDSDLAEGRVKDGKVIVRFPPEPNGYLHLGHVKSIILNAGIAEAYGGEINLRFDDTNPDAESVEYVESIKRDAFWIHPGFDRVLWASDYFGDIYECAETLVRKGLAYVDDSDLESVRKMRGDYNSPGVDSPCRTRTPEENLVLLRGMRDGRFADGEKILRAKIDMAHPNLNMRDPLLYRIKRTAHHNSGNEWIIYPMYDFAHPISDGLEGITHSICTLEFEDHRPLYDWVAEKCSELLKSKPRQIEFAKLELEGVVLSKRRLSAIVSEGKVSGWDDPRMPTIAGLRNRGFTPEILKEFILRSGFSKANSRIEASVLDESVRDVLGPVVPRTMAILDPVELVFSNFMNVESKTVPNHPKKPELGERTLSFTETIWIDSADVRAEAEEGFWRVYPGNVVRLKHTYNFLVLSVESDASGKPTKVVGEIDYGSSNPKEAKSKAKVAIHWLSESDAENCDSFVYGRLFDENGDFSIDSVKTFRSKIERTAVESEPALYEFERNGYFKLDGRKAHCLALLKK